jgi:hypothetical protein
MPRRCRVVPCKRALPSRAPPEYLILRSGARSRFILILAGTIMMFASGLASTQSTPSPQSAQEAAF